MTNYSRSVLLSNGLHHSENLPVKFGFSPKIVPANIVQKLPSQRCSKPLFIAFFNFSHKRPTFAFTGESGYTLGSRRKIAHSGTHGETGAFRTGPLSLPSTRTARSRTSPGRVPERRTLPLWDLAREVLSKNAESLRDSDALMRVAVPQASRPRWAALLCLQFGDVAVFSLCAQGFPHMQKRVWYHYPQRALRAAETPDGRLSKRFIFRFLRSGGHH